MSESHLNVSELSWSIELLQEIWQRHQDVKLFVSDPNILELAFKRVLLLDPCPKDVESKFLELVSSISGKLTEDHVTWINALSRNVGVESSAGVERRGRDVSVSFLQTLLCSLPGKILAGVEPEVFDLLFKSSTANHCDRLVAAVGKIR